jgi:hypothetical protein
MASFNGQGVFAPIPSIDGPRSQHPESESSLEWLFSGGLDHSLPPHQIPDGCCWVMNNFWYPREGGRPETRPGLERYSAGTGLPGKPTAGTTYAKNSTTCFLVMACLNATGDDQELYYLDNTTKEWVQIASSLGSTTPPTFATFNGRLLLAVAGEYPREWAGFTGASPAKATGTVTVADYTKLSAGETLTVGGRTYTFQASRTQPGEIAIGSSNNDVAAKIRAAIATDSWDVVAGGSGASVTLTCSYTGADGNSIGMSETTGGGVTVSASTLSGGADGLALDTISTYQAPKPGIIVADGLGSVIASGDPNHPDRLHWSAPTNEFGWAWGAYGAAVYIDVGCNEGNAVVAVTPGSDEVLIHKNGNHKQVFRLRVVDPNPEGWFIQPRRFGDTAAAVNQQCAVTAGGNHLCLDRDFMRVFPGAEDTYSELSSGTDGAKVYDLIAGTTRASAFMVVDPYSIVVLIFPSEGLNCLVFHYGSKRWSTFQYALSGGRTLACGFYSETFQTVFFGCSDGHVYVPDPTLATDDEANFPQEIVGKSVMGGTKTLVVKESILDFRHLLTGSGSIGIVPDRNSSQAVVLKKFAIQDASLTVAELTMPVYGMTFPLRAGSLGTTGSTQQVRGSAIAPRVLVSAGAIGVNNATLRIAAKGGEDK